MLTFFGPLTRNVDELITMSFFQYHKPKTLDEKKKTFEQTMCNPEMLSEHYCLKRKVATPFNVKKKSFKLFPCNPFLEEKNPLFFKTFSNIYFVYHFFLQPFFFRFPKIPP